MEPETTHTLIEVKREATVGSAAGLKIELLDALATGLEVRANLSLVEEIDLTSMQLFWAAAREEAGSQRRLRVEVSQTAGDAARELGFDHFPGTVRVV